MKSSFFPSRNAPRRLTTGVPLLVALGLARAVLAADATPPSMIAVTPLQAQGVSTSDAAVLTESLSDEIVQSGNVRVMERTQMDKILAEQGFQSATCDTSECALQMGRLLGIERILVGTVGKVGETYSVSVRMVDVNTGEILSSSRRNAKGAIDDVLVKVMPLLAQDLTNGRRNEAKKDPVPPKKKQEEVSSGSSGSSVLWWTLGGATLLGGGAAAAYVLLADGKSPAAPPVPPSSDLVDVQVVAP